MAEVYYTGFSTKIRMDDYFLVSGRTSCLLFGKALVDCNSFPILSRCHLFVIINLKVEKSHSSSFHLLTSESQRVFKTYVVRD